jgi:hypothetical protein
MVLMMPETKNDCDDEAQQEIPTLFPKSLPLETETVFGQNVINYLNEIWNFKTF